MANTMNPDDFNGKHKGQKCLIIGCGYSAGRLTKYKSQLCDRFDVVIGVNKAFVEFDDVMTYHLVTEKTSKNNGYDLAQTLNSNIYNTKMVRFINKKGVSFYDRRYNIVEITRSKQDGFIDLEHYHNGFLTGPVSNRGFSIGSVVLQALHLAVMIGSKEIYLVGADLCFKNDNDHFYGDRFYRDPPKTVKKENRHVIVKVDGLETTDYFRDSAAYIDNIILNQCAALNVSVFDFSDGLIKAANHVDIDEYFKETK